MSRRAARESERGQTAERDLRDALDRSQNPTADADVPAPAGLPEPVDHVTTTLPQVAGYRMRDFSPEGRRAPDTLPAQSAPTDDGTPLNYRTQAAAPIVSAVPTALRSASADGQRQRPEPHRSTMPQGDEPRATAVDLNAPERTMTRRELRALREAQAAAQQSTPPQLIEPQKPEAATLGAPLSLPAQPAPSVQAQAPLETPVTPAAAPHTVQAPVPLVAPAPAAAPARPASPVLTQAPTDAPQPVSPAAAQAQKPLFTAPATPAQEPAAKLVPQAPVPLVTKAAVAAQATPADEFDRLIAHDGATSYLAPSALVLPSIPTHSDLPRALDGTGEILITGSMDLPRGFGTSTAEHSGLDGIEVDRLLDAEDRSIAPSNSSPVRASRAVSTHTATRGMIQPKRPSNGNKMLAVLAVTASALAVVVVGLVVVGFVTGVF